MEVAVLTRYFDGNPIGKDSAIASLASPGIKLVGAYLARLADRARAHAAVGRSVKLFLDEAECLVDAEPRDRFDLANVRAIPFGDDHRDAVAYSVVLSLWQPLGTAFAATTDPQPRPQNMTVSVKPLVYRETVSHRAASRSTPPLHASLLESHLTELVHTMDLGTVHGSDKLGNGLRNQYAYRGWPLSFARDETTQLASQRHKCISCGNPISNTMISKNYAPCRLLDALCCKRRCHDDDKRRIPWRVILANDDQLHRVSKAAANFLDDRSSEPIIRLPQTAAIFMLEPSMKTALHLRRRLAGLARGAMEGRPGAIKATDAILQRLPEHAMHLALEDCEFWSLDDIAHAKDGSLLNLLSTAIADAMSAFARAAAEYRTSKTQRA